MNLFAPHITDGYKLSHSQQNVSGTEQISSNFTPRDFSYAPTLPFTKTNKMVFVGLQYAIKEYLIKIWDDSFFIQPKEKVIGKYSRRIKSYLGTDQAKETQEMMIKLHDLGYLPIKIKSLPEGSKVNAGIPVFVVTNTLPEFAPLVNYIESVLSTTVWPMCNSASLIEQYYLLAKMYGEMTGASEEFWLPFTIHNFAMRGHRGVEDGIISAFGHILFSVGSDTFSVMDFVEDYYNANSDTELIAASVSASEHATVCQNIAFNGGGHDGEVKTLKHFLTNVYPTGIFSYVSDSRDYWDVIGNISLELKDIIVNRQPNQDGQPGVLTFRPDSSVDTPYEVLLGYKVLEVDDLYDANSIEVFLDSGYNAVLYKGKYYKAEVHYDECTEYGETYRTNVFIDTIRELNEFEAKGTFQSLWDNFSGTMVTGSNGKQYKLLDSHVRVIYGEAISLDMAYKIYRGMEESGWCVGNVFFGVGSWAFIGNSSRDSYGVACKATNSVINGTDYPLQKDPKGTSTFKKSAKGRLRVEKSGNDFVLFDNQTIEQENMGELVTVFVDGKMVKETSLKEIRELVRK